MEKFLRSGKKRPGGIDGLEKLNVQDVQENIWQVTLRDISNLQGEVIKIGEITYEDLNLLEESESLEITFEDAKEEGFIFLRGYAVVSEDFDNGTYGYEYFNTNGINAVAFAADAVVSRTEFPTKALQDITVTLTLLYANLQDWTAGVLDIYIEVKKFPV